MLIEYDKSPRATLEQRIRSLADSTRRALEEARGDNDEQMEAIKDELKKLKDLQNESTNENPTEGADKHYTYNQNTASDTWVIEHNLGKYPSVEVVDSAGTVVIGEVQHISTDKVEIKFMAPFSGKAFFN